MRQTLLAAAAAFVIGGITTGAVLSRAQPAPPSPEPVDGAPPPAGHHWMGGWHHHAAGGHGEMLRTFALIYRQSDRQLAPADVQKIAEAFLLWNGNHSWKVINVAPMADGPIAFSLATPDGGVIAKFTMDPHTGKIARVG
jgi:hypothetical protein